VSKLSLWRTICLVCAFCALAVIGSPADTFTTLYRFGSQPTDGANPTAGLIQATDGNLYGTTLDGGANNAGTIFKITPAGKLTTLYSFCSQTNNEGYCTDGNSPTGLVQATNGNFYGTRNLAELWIAARCS